MGESTIGDGSSQFNGHSDDKSSQYTLPDASQKPDSTVRQARALTNHPAAEEPTGAGDEKITQESSEEVDGTGGLSNRQTPNAAAADSADAAKFDTLNSDAFKKELANIGGESAFLTEVQNVNGSSKTEIVALHNGKPQVVTTSGGEFHWGRSVDIDANGKVLAGGLAGGGLISDAVTGVRNFVGDYAQGFADSIPFNRYYNNIKDIFSEPFQDNVSMERLRQDVSNAPNNFDKLGRLLSSQQNPIVMPQNQMPIFGEAISATAWTSLHGMPTDVPPALTDDPEFKLGVNEGMKGALPDPQPLNLMKNSDVSTLRAEIANTHSTLTNKQKGIMQGRLNLYKWLSHEKEFFAEASAQGTSFNANSYAAGRKYPFEQLSQEFDLRIGTEDRRNLSYNNFVNLSAERRLGIYERNQSFLTHEQRAAIIDMNFRPSNEPNFSTAQKVGAIGSIFGQATAASGFGFGIVGKFAAAGLYEALMGIGRAVHRDPNWQPNAGERYVMRATANMTGYATAGLMVKGTAGAVDLMRTTLGGGGAGAVKVGPGRQLSPANAWAGTFWFTGMNAAGGAAQGAATGAQGAVASTANSFVGATGGMLWPSGMAGGLTALDAVLGGPSAPKWQFMTRGGVLGNTAGGLTDKADWARKGLAGLSAGVMSPTSDFISGVGPGPTAARGAVGTFALAAPYFVVHAETIPSRHPGWNAHFNPPAAAGNPSPAAAQQQVVLEMHPPSGQVALPMMQSAGAQQQVVADIHQMPQPVDEPHPQDGGGGGGRSGLLRTTVSALANGARRFASTTFPADGGGSGGSGKTAQTLAQQQPQTSAAFGSSPLQQAPQFAISGSLPHYGTGDQEWNKARNDLFKKPMTQIESEADDLYKTKNIIGRTGSGDDATVYYQNGKTFGRITRNHTDGMNIGREPPITHEGYSIDNIGGALQERIGTHIIHKSRSEFVRVNTQAEREALSNAHTDFIYFKPTFNYEYNQAKQQRDNLRATPPRPQDDESISPALSPEIEPSIILAQRATLQARLSSPEFQGKLRENNVPAAMVSVQDVEGIPTIIINYQRDNYKALDPDTGRQLFEVQNVNGIYRKNPGGRGGNRASASDTLSGGVGINQPAIELTPHPSDQPSPTEQAIALRQASEQTTADVTRLSQDLSTNINQQLKAQGLTADKMQYGRISDLPDGSTKLYLEERAPGSKRVEINIDSILKSRIHTLTQKLATGTPNEMGNAGFSIMALMGISTQMQTSGSLSASDMVNAGVASRQLLDMSAGQLIAHWLEQAPAAAAAAAAASGVVANGVTPTLSQRYLPLFTRSQASASATVSVGNIGGAALGTGESMAQKILGTGVRMLSAAAKGAPLVDTAIGAYFIGADAHIINTSADPVERAGAITRLTFNVLGTAAGTGLFAAGVVAPALAGAIAPVAGLLLPFNAIGLGVTVLAQEITENRSRVWGYREVAQRLSESEAATLGTYDSANGGTLNLAVNQDAGGIEATVGENESTAKATIPSKNRDWGMGDIHEDPSQVDTQSYRKKHPYGGFSTEPDDPELGRKEWRPKDFSSKQPVKNIILPAGNSVDLRVYYQTGSSTAGLTGSAFWPAYQYDKKDKNGKDIKPITDTGKSATINGTKAGLNFIMPGLPDMKSISHMKDYQYNLKGHGSGNAYFMNYAGHFNIDGGARGKDNRLDFSRMQHGVKIDLGNSGPQQVIQAGQQNFILTKDEEARVRRDKASWEKEQDAILPPFPPDGRISFVARGSPELKRLHELRKNIFEADEKLKQQASLPPNADLSTDLLTITQANIDTVIGSQGDDELIGNDRNNVLYGGPGNDTLRGGNGVNTYVLKAGDSGIKTIDLTKTDGQPDQVMINDISVKDMHDFYFLIQTEKNTLELRDRRKPDVSLARFINVQDAAKLNFIAQDGSQVQFGLPPGVPGDSLSSFPGKRELLMTDFQETTSSSLFRESYSPGVLNYGDLAQWKPDAENPDPRSSYSKPLRYALNGQNGASYIVDEVMGARFFYGDKTDNYMSGQGNLPTVMKGGLGADTYKVTLDSPLVTINNESSDNVTDTLSMEDFDVANIQSTVLYDGPTKYLLLEQISPPKALVKIRAFDQAGSQHLIVKFKGRQQSILTSTGLENSADTPPQ